MATMLVRHPPSPAVPPVRRPRVTVGVGFALGIAGAAACEDPGPPPTVMSVAPGQGFHDQATPIAFTGDGFVAGFDVDVWDRSRSERPDRFSGFIGGPGTPEAQQKAQLSIARGNNGHYQVAGSINGHPVQFLVDTGATSVAMNESQARRLGIDYRVKGLPMKASTAGGTVNAWRVSFDRIKIGSLEVLGVEGAVIEGEAPVEVLLGMSFLNRVRWREEQGVLMLESKF